MVVLLWAGAAGVDLGFSVWGSRSAQAEADTAALDLSKYLDIADAQVSQTATKNYLDGIIAKIKTDNSYGSGTTITEIPGKWSNGVWSIPVACSTATPPVPLGCNAVKVTATQKVPQIFYGGFNNLSARTAIAANTPEAGFSIGSFLANVNTQNSQIAGQNTLLGSIGSANITLVGYEGLETSNVTLNQLISADSTVLSPTNILSVSMTPSQWLSILKTALGNQIINVNCNTSSAPGACEAYNSVLGSMLTFNSSQQVKICQLFWINPSTVPPTGNSCSNTSVNTTGLQASLNVMQMLTTMAEVANGSSGVELQAALNISPITSAKVYISLIQPPVVAYGPVGTQATTAQVNVRVDISALGISLLSIALNGATGTATLSNINCSGNAMQQTTITGSTNVASGTVSLAGIGLGTVSVVGVSSVNKTFAGTNVPPNSSTLANGLNPVLIGSQSPSLAYSGISILNAGVVALGILNGALQTALPQVLSTLGVTVAGAAISDLSTNCAAVSIVQ
jgi:uncharacterized membrane protein